MDARQGLAQAVWSDAAIPFARFEAIQEERGAPISAEVRWLLSAVSFGPMELSFGAWAVIAAGLEIAVAARTRRESKRVTRTTIDGCTVLHVREWGRRWTPPSAPPPADDDSAHVMKLLPVLAKGPLFKSMADVGPGSEPPTHLPGAPKRGATKKGSKRSPRRRS
jgi:hypothetical protein